MWDGVEEFREFHNKQKQLKRIRKEEEQREKKERLKKKQRLRKSQSNYVPTTTSSNKKSSSGWSFNGTKPSSTTAKDGMAKSHSLQRTSKMQSQQTTAAVNSNTVTPTTSSRPSMHSETRSVPPKNSHSKRISHSAEERISPMIAPIGHGAVGDLMMAPMAIPPTAEATESEHERELSVSLTSLKEQEHEQRKRVWDSLKVLSKDPIPHIAATANKVRAYLTSDKNKSARSRALSDVVRAAATEFDKEHAQLLQEQRPQSTRAAKRTHKASFNDE